MPLWYRKMGKRAYIFFGQNRHRSGFDQDGDGFTELPKLKNQTVGFRSYLKMSTYSKLTFEYHHMNEYRRGGNLVGSSASMKRISPNSWSIRLMEEV